MGVAAHLKIEVGEYDRRIRTFIPRYEEILDAAASTLSLLDRRSPTVVDLGIGTGALALRCLAAAPRARLVGIDADDQVLAVARRRLASRPGARHELIHGSFTAVALPRCDGVVASMALHHIRSRRTKARLYARCLAALRPGGLLINADCCPSSDARLAAAEFEAWRAHLRRTYSARQTRAFFRAWAREDVYVPLEDELSMLRAAGFRTDVRWRAACFAVVVASKSARRRV